MIFYYLIGLFLYDIHKIAAILTPKNGKHSQNVWLSAHAFVTLLLISRNREK